MCNLDFKEAANSAMSAKVALEQRTKENADNWAKTSNGIKDVWTRLNLPPKTFRIGQDSFVCSATKGIVSNAEALLTPKVLVELIARIKECLDLLKKEYDSQMQP